jgi:hypothetical protein
MFGEAQDLYGQHREYFPGQAVAGLQGDTITGQDMTRDNALAFGGQMNPQLMGALSNQLNATDVANNPHLAAAVQAAMNPVMRQLQEQALPGVRAGATQAGQYGSSRQGVLESNAIRDATGMMADRSAGMYSDAYAQGLQAQGNALSRAGGVFNTMMQPGMAMDAVGQQNRMHEQELINDQMNRWNFQQEDPWQQLQRYQSAVGGNFGSTSTSTQQGAQGSLLSNAVGGATSATGLWNMLKPASQSGNFSGVPGITQGSQQDTMLANQNAYFK